MRQLLASRYQVSKSRSGAPGRRSERVTATRLIEATATLRAVDVTALAEWYRDKLGFTISMSWGEPAEYARVRRDAVELAIGRLGERFGPSSVYAIVSGVDALYAEFVARGVEMGRAISDAPYRM